MKKESPTTKRQWIRCGNKNTSRLLPYQPMCQLNKNRVQRVISWGLLKCSPHCFPSKRHQNPDNPNHQPQYNKTSKSTYTYPRTTNKSSQFVKVKPLKNQPKHSSKNMVSISLIIQVSENKKLNNQSNNFKYPLIMYFVQLMNQQMKKINQLLHELMDKKENFVGEEFLVWLIHIF